MKDLLKEYEDNGILIEETDVAIYKLTFDRKYASHIQYNLRTFGWDFILLNAKNRAVMEGKITNFIAEPSVTVVKSNPFIFQVNGPFAVAVYFAQRIITQ